MTIALIDQTVHELGASTGAKAVCLVALTRHGVEVLGCWSASDSPPHAVLLEQFKHLDEDWRTADHPRWLHAAAGELPEVFPFQRAWSYPIKVPRVLQYYRGSPDDPILTAGVLFLFDPERIPSGDITDSCGYHLQVICALLDRYVLDERLEINLVRGRTLGAVAVAVNSAGTYQQALDGIVPFVSEDNITSCAILLYEYGQELTDGERDVSNIERLRVVGTWDSDRGSGIAIKLAFKIERYTSQIERLHAQHQIQVRHVEDFLKDIDPFAASFLRAAQIRTGMVVALRSGSENLGLLALGMREDHRFTQRQLSTIQMIAELLSLKITMLNVEQQRMRELQGRSTLLDSVTDGVMYVLPTREAGGTVRVANQRFIEMFSIPTEIPFQLSLSEIIDQMYVTEDVRETLRADWLHRPVNDPSLWRGEFSLVFKGGVRGDVAWYSAPVYERGNLGGAILGRVYIFTDMTAQRAAERLRASFLARASHELRTPLQSIQGYAEMILEDDRAAINATTRDYATTILSGAQRLRRMVNDMIDITRVEAGELRPNRQELDLADVIFDVAAELEVQYRAKHQRLVFAPDQPVPPVNADYDRLVQVLINLIANAIKYSPPETVITVTMQQVENQQALSAAISGAPADIRFPCALVVIRDQGPGLNVDELEAVFMPFHRTESSKRQRIEGAGLGLVVTRSIIEAHGGRVWAVPALIAGGGCFAFTLPL